MTTIPSFSVIIPTYNRAVLLPEAIRSVLGQTLNDFELLVVDDGSMDGTPQVVDSFNDHRIRYVPQRHRGAAAARNRGARLSHGRFITFLDSDDEVLPSWLQRIATVLASRECAVVCCGATLTGSSGETERLPRDMGPMFEHQTGLFLAGTFAVRRDLFELVGGYVPSLAHAENSELALRLISACRLQRLRISAIDEVLVRIRVRDIGRSDDAAKLFAATYMLEAHRERMKRSHLDLSNHNAIAGVSSARLGMYSAARQFFARAIRAQCWNPKNYLRFLAATMPPVGEKVWGTGDTT